MVYIGRANWYQGYLENIQIFNCAQIFNLQQSTLNIICNFIYILGGTGNSPKSDPVQMEGNKSLNDSGVSIECGVSQMMPLKDIVHIKEGQGKPMFVIHPIEGTCFYNNLHPIDHITLFP